MGVTSWRYVMSSFSVVLHAVPVTAVRVSGYVFSATRNWFPQRPTTKVCDTDVGYQRGSRTVGLGEWAEHCSVDW
jgi:hypothetical protein